MNKSLKIVTYVVLTVGTLWLGVAFRANYARIMDPVSEDPTAGRPPAAGDTNSIHTQRVGRLMLIGGVLFGVVVGLGLLVAHDVAHVFAHEVEQFIFDDVGEVTKDPEYDRAEQVWADGKFLEAIQLMRDYLAEHPREQYVALRIAEIYEKDLGNYLAAALEYEEILNKKLSPERWGWAAIHLANLYSGRLDRVKDAEALLHRIVEEYGQTAAAKKARERLGIPEPVVEVPPEPEPAPTAPPESIEQQMAALHAELQQRAQQQEAQADPPAAPPAEPEKSASKLPPGFRPKTDY